MRTISFTALDCKGIELSDGDIITNELGVQTVAYFNEKKRCFLAYDEAPFPCDITEETITRSFWIIGNVSRVSNFKPRYESAIVHAQARKKR